MLQPAGSKIDPLFVIPGEVRNVLQLIEGLRQRLTLLSPGGIEALQLLQYPADSFCLAQDGTLALVKQIVQLARAGKYFLAIRKNDLLVFEIFPFVRAQIRSPDLIHLVTQTVYPFEAFPLVHCRGVYSLLYPLEGLMAFPQLTHRRIVFSEAVQKPQMRFQIQQSVLILLAVNVRKMFSDRFEK